MEMESLMRSIVRRKLQTGTRRTSSNVAILNVLVSLSVVVGLAASPAWAGTSVSCAPTYAQGAVTVGDTLLNATLYLANNSDGDEGEPPETVTLTNLKNTPACGTDTGFVCTGTDIDNDVFTVSATATGIAPPGPNNVANTNATACVGRMFTVTVADAVTGWEAGRLPLVRPRERQL